VLSLSQFSTAEDCRQRLHELAQTEPGVVIVFADMRETTARQTSFLTDQINAHLPRALAIVVEHFPPELSMSFSSFYSAIFLSGWDYIYIDYISTPSDDAEDTVRATDDAKPKTTNDNTSVPLDAHFWFLKACGLRPPSVSPNGDERSADPLSLSGSLHSFCELLHDTVGRLCSSAIRPPVDPRQRATSPFASSAKFRETVHKLITEHPCTTSPELHV
jgi:hypothetical protein